MGHYGTMCKSKRRTKPELGVLAEQGGTGDGNFCNLNMINTGWGKKKKKTLPHTAYDEFRGWVSSKPEGHPELPVSASLCVQGYEQLEVPLPRVKDKKFKTVTLPDTGAQMTVAGIKLIHSLGITKSELIPLSHGVNCANNMGLGLLGGVLVTFSGKDCHGGTRVSKQLCYIAEGIDSVFLSRAACTDLGLVSKNFPTKEDLKSNNMNAIYKNNTENKCDGIYQVDSLSTCKGVVVKGNDDSGSRLCSCHKRELPPQQIKILPFPAIL